MLIGICVDNTNCNTLTVGEEYYLFPNGENYYYVSKFPNIKSNMGCFQKKRFKKNDYKKEEKKIVIYKNDEQLRLF